MKPLLSLLLGAFIMSLIWISNESTDYRITLQQDSIAVSERMYKTLYLECNGKIAKENRDSVMWVREK